jgi:hypothetical protein
VTGLPSVFRLARPVQRTGSCRAAVWGGLTGFAVLTGTRFSRRWLRRAGVTPSPGRSSRPVERQLPGSAVLSGRVASCGTAEPLHWVALGERPTAEAFRAVDRLQRRGSPVQAVSSADPISRSADRPASICGSTSPTVDRAHTRAARARCAPRASALRGAPWDSSRAPSRTARSAWTFSRTPRTAASAGSPVGPTRFAHKVRACPPREIVAGVGQP